MRTASLLTTEDPMILAQTTETHIEIVDNENRRHGELVSLLLHEALHNYCMYKKQALSEKREHYILKGLPSNAARRSSTSTAR